MSPAMTAQLATDTCCRFPQPDTGSTTVLVD
jgi:hypothetical protein